MMGFHFLMILGLLGLLAIPVLILIYLLKPNYQNKLVSSTFIWKLSLKYKKKRIPINKIRNLLLIICQVLIITVCTLIMAHPELTNALATEGREEGVVIIDTSASMNAQTGGQTRFQRAVEDACDYIDQKFSKNGYVTVVLAGKTPEFLTDSTGKALVRSSKTDREVIIDALQSATCTYETCDAAAALESVESILSTNSKAEVFFYTATEYRETGRVEIKDVKPEGGEEWNAAILTCDAAIDENEYLFTVELASYDREQDVDLAIDIIGANDNGSGGYDYKDLHYKVRCEVDGNGKGISTRAEFKASDCGITTPITSFKRVYFRFENINDSLESDNSYYLYGGERDEIRIQLYSSDPNSFFYLGLLNLSNQFKNDLDLIVDRVDEGKIPQREGYDFYLYEHTLPDVVKQDGLPTDGVVFLCDPDALSIETGLMLDLAETNTATTGLVPVTAGDEHPITQYLRMERIQLTKYRKINSYTDDYKVLMSCEGSPVMVVRDDATTKLVVMTFSVNYSTLVIEREFMVLLYNMIDHFVPLTMEKNVAYVGEEFSFQARGAELHITGDGVDKTVTSFPSTFVFETPGTFLFSQKLLSSATKEDYLYVRIDPEESNIFRTVDRLEFEAGVEETFEPLDFLLYLSIALLVLLLAEWWLQSREYLV